MLKYMKKNMKIRREIECIQKNQIELVEMKNKIPGIKI